MSILEGFRRLQLHVVLWFVRLAWPVFLLWGLWDLGLYLNEPSEDHAADAAIRITGGVVLFLMWVFCVRTRGRWTLNRAHRLLD